MSGTPRVRRSSPLTRDARLQLDRANNKCRSLRRQLDELEDETARERARARALQRELEEGELWRTVAKSASKRRPFVIAVAPSEA